MLMDPWSPLRKQSRPLHVPRSFTASMLRPLAALLHSCLQLLAEAAAASAAHPLPLPPPQLQADETLRE